MKQKIKITIKPPRCRACRERMREGELENILKMIEEAIKNRLGTGIPITITIKKLARKNRLKEKGQKVNR